jgi:hypothetical protein
MEQDLSLLASLLESAQNELHRLKAAQVKQAKPKKGMTPAIKESLERRRRIMYRKR